MSRKQWDTRRDTSPKIKETNGFETGLTQKQKFYLYFYSVCPSIDIIHTFWQLYNEYNKQDTLNFYMEISPFRPHPCGDDSILRMVAGFVDPDMFLHYYQPRESFLGSIQMIGNPDFLCQFPSSKELLEQSINYFDRLISEPQIKLTKLKKLQVLEKAINKLCHSKFPLNKDQSIRYLLTCFKMYNNIRILNAYPIGIDCNGKLCRFD